MFYFPLTWIVVCAIGLGHFIYVMKSIYCKDDYYSPGWKQRSKEIKALDANACQFCGSKRQLTVHHWCYIEGKDVWDYEDHDLITLCWDCHKNEHYFTAVEQKIRENGKKE